MGEGESFFALGRIFALGFEDVSLSECGHSFEGLISGNAILGTESVRNLKPDRSFETAPSPIGWERVGVRAKASEPNPGSNLALLECGAPKNILQILCNFFPVVLSHTGGRSDSSGFAVSSIGEYSVYGRRLEQVSIAVQLNWWSNT